MMSRSSVAPHNPLETQGVSNGKLAPSFAIVTRREFDFFVNGALLHFNTGQVIEDATLIPLLLGHGAPVERVSDSDDLILCPHCRRHFTVQHAVAGEDGETD